MVLFDPAVNHDTIYGHTRLSTLMCLISSGYFLYDLIVVLLRFDQEGAAFLVHASCCLFVYTYAVYSFYLHFFGEQDSSQPVAVNCIIEASYGVGSVCSLLPSPMKARFCGVTCQLVGVSRKHATRG